MTSNKAMEYGSRPIKGDRLLSVPDVAEILGVCDVTASKVMHESGCLVKIRRRNYVLESRFYHYLRKKTSEAFTI